MKYKLNYTFLCNLILTNFVVDGFWRLKFITQIYEGENNGHGEKEGLPTEYHYIFEQVMLKHVHDLKKDLREKGCGKESLQRYLRPHFWGVKTQMQNWGLSLNETCLYLLTLLLPPYTFGGSVTCKRWSCKELN